MTAAERVSYLNASRAAWQTKIARKKARHQPTAYEQWKLNRETNKLMRAEMKLEKEFAA